MMKNLNGLTRDECEAATDARTARDLRQTFHYIFNPPAQRGGGIPQVSLFEIGGAFTLGGLEVVPVPLLHGARPILGFRIGALGIGRSVVRCERTRAHRL